MKVMLAEAYVLHRRPYRETSYLIELLTKDYGRVSVIAKGVRMRRPHASAKMELFTPLLISWMGKKDLMTLTACEERQSRTVLKGRILYLGFYLNELLMRLLHKGDPHPLLYVQYELTLQALSCISTQPETQDIEEQWLRRFEKHLLSDVGYGFLPKTKDEFHQRFAVDEYYLFTPTDGFKKTANKHEINVYPGHLLLNIVTESWDQATLKATKSITRQLIASLLGEHPVYSRQLFLKPNESRTQ